MTANDISVVIPTYHRGQVLIETVESLLLQKGSFRELLIMDQTQEHAGDLKNRLERWHESGEIKWIKLDRPSIPAAMNQGLLESVSDIVLFLDDDIIPGENLVREHLKAHASADDIVAVVGQIIQPEGRKVWGDFCFASQESCYTEHVMAGNLSVKKEKAIQAGGFDENFIQVAYKFETEFAERLMTGGGKILFNPGASITHLREKKGGTRVFGDFRATISPAHAVGAYYYFFRSRKINHPLLKSAERFFRSIYAKHYLYKPWWIPVTLVAEFSGFILALILLLKGPKLLDPNTCSPVT